MKRTYDSLMSICALLVLSPFMLILATLIRWKLGSPILFRQTRPGLNGHPFEMIKFRTMTDGRDAEGVLLPDTERLSRFGIFLRKTSLDELPEIWNVIKGNMSLVGPRPLLVEYLDRYTPEQSRRHEVRPGITGWAQVNGRQDIKFSKRFEYDVWYVDHQSFLLDIKILVLTFCRVMQREGVRSGQDVREVDDLGASVATSLKIKTERRLSDENSP